jgi:PAS domain S-box-containing protein
MSKKNKIPIIITLKQRIYWSFSVLVFLFVINGIVTLVILNNHSKEHKHISAVTDPSIEALHDLRRVMRESIMFTTNWVFIRSDAEDKNDLKNLHVSVFPALKTKLNSLSLEWHEKHLEDSLKNILTGFAQLILDERSIMSLLQKFDDYNDPSKKFEAEEQLESVVLPQSLALFNSLNNILKYEIAAKEAEEEKLSSASAFLRTLITLLTISTVCLGIFFSIYMANKIISPIQRIRGIINDLGRGITRKTGYNGNTDEIGKMAHSVNNLCDKLQGTANFAHEVGMRNFDIPFEPLSEEDTLGKALIAMRDNLKTSEQQLIDANTEIQTIYNAALDAVVIIDEEGKIVKWDHKAEILFGWKEDEVMGMTLSETIVPFRYREAHQRGMKHFLKTGEGPVLGKTIEVQALRKNNDEFDISLSISPSFVKDKYRFIGFIRDITSRKKAEAEKRHSEERYRQIVETAREGIWMIDENNRTSFVNKQLCEILGYTPEEMIGKELYYFMDEEGKTIASTIMEDRKRGMSDAFDFKFITKEDKVIWTHLSNSPILDDNGKYTGAMAMVTDITQRKLDEELLQRSEMILALKNKELEQKNKELEQFAFVASHDLQEPLRTTASFVDLLQQQYKGKLDQKADKYLDYILQASDRMTILITDLLEYSRIGDNRELEDVDCNSTMSEVLTDLDTAINNSEAEIKMESLPVIQGYQAEIKQLFQSLTYNAIKFRQKNISPRLNISVSKQRDTWQFAFADNGIGIAKEHNEKIFNIFQRLHTRNEYKGSGIGLSNCKKIVELHKGKIWVESTPGKGSTFYFTVPVSPAPVFAIKTREAGIQQNNTNDV